LCPVALAAVVGLGFAGCKTEADLPAEWPAAFLWDDDSENSAWVIGNSEWMNGSNSVWFLPAQSGNPPIIKIGTNLYGLKSVNSTTPHPTYTVHLWDKDEEKFAEGADWSFQAVVTGEGEDVAQITFSAITGAGIDILLTAPYTARYSH
jgi:hypothetical protein